MGGVGRALTERMARQTVADPAYAALVAELLERRERERRGAPGIMAGKSGRPLKRDESGAVVELPPAPDPDALLTAADVARLLGVPTSTVWALSREHKIPTVTLGERTRRYRRGAILEWVEALERASLDE
jgi:excisionase family DNA binding protein